MAKIFALSYEEMFYKINQVDKQESKKDIRKNNVLLKNGFKILQNYKFKKTEKTVIFYLKKKVSVSIFIILFLCYHEYME